CRHHWDIEEAHGPVALGTCRFCGKEKEFETSYGNYYNGVPLNYTMTSWDRRSDWVDG
ncbi:hypothetical protein LCGC14_3149580, partial [marine sediment metagenome]